MAPVPFVLAAGAVGYGVAGGVATNIVTAGYRRLVDVVTVRGYERTDAFGRFCYLLESSYSEEMPELTRETLLRWRDDPTFMGVYHDLVAGADIAETRSALVAALTPLMPATEGRTAQEAAARVADGLPWVLYETQNPDERVLLYLHEARNAMQAGFAQLSSQMQEGFGQVSSPIFIMGSDWPHEQALARAREADPQGLANLTRDLEDRDRAEQLSRLVGAPRDWMANLQAAVWEYIALLCDEAGLWEEAKLAWLKARERPGADFAGCSVRAAEAALGAGQPEEAVELLNEARADTPDHPRIAFHDAIAITDAEECLAALNAITGADVELAAMVFVAKASCYLNLNALTKSREMLAGAKEAGGESTLGYRITESSLAVMETQAIQSPEQARIDELVAQSLTLEEELLCRNQTVQAAGLRGQASAFRAFSGDFEGATTVLLEAVPTYENKDADARLTLGMAAAHLQAEDVIRPLLRAEDAHRLRARYLTALLAVNGSDEDKAAAVVQLDELLNAEDPHIRALAAMKRLAIASQVPDVRWSQAAEAIIAPQQPEPVAIFKSFFLENTNRPEQAEALLLRSSDEPWAMSELMRLALRQQEWSKAAQHADAVIRNGTDWFTRLAAADAFQRNDDGPRALSEFEDLAADEHAPPAVRADASRALVQADLRAQQYESAQRRCERWLTFEPDCVDAGVGARQRTSSARPRRGRVRGVRASGAPPPSASRILERVPAADCLR